MSRLESNAEPSMEEILASIRKIIAEEPPGSRATPLAPPPGPVSAQSPSPQRGFMSREAFMRSSAPAEPEVGEPSFDAAISERSPEPLNAARPALSKPGQDESRAEASGLSKGSDTGHESPKVRGSDLAGDTEPEAASIDAQLVDLLDDDLNALNGATLVDAGAGTARRAATGAPQVTLESEPRSGFTVSRMGLTNGDADSRENSDPFAFDLGPSPFLPRPPAASSADVQTAPSAPAKDHSEQSSGTIYGERRNSVNGSAVSVATKQPSVTPPSSMAASAPGGPETMLLPGARPAEPFVVPSVAATLGPSRKLEPLSAAFHPAPVERSSGQSSPHVSPLSDYARQAVERIESRREQPETMLQSGYSNDAKLDRAIEDTVADLLRPMLRTWLAENMPKIVERALRREISERLLPGQKSSFD